MQDEIAQRPNSLPWPPLLYLAAIAAAVVIEMWVPSLPVVTGSVHSALRAFGFSLLALGAGLDVWAMLVMTRARANILPHRAASALVTTGPFRLSRNPIYLGNTLMMIGAGVAFLNAWLIATGLMAAFGVHHLAVLREEAHLAAKFGDAWRVYAAATPRWLGRGG